VDHAGVRRDFDVCIIGTGAGGGVMLDQLTRAGFEVVALQRGPQLPLERFSDDELEVIVRDALFAPDHLESYRLDERARAEPGRWNPVAHAVGGTMTRWSGWSWRFREDDFRVLSPRPCPRAALADGRSRMPARPGTTCRARVRRVWGSRREPVLPPRSGPYPNRAPPRRSA
jgi:choline dehydrogenase-like flavoprotein